MTAEQDGCVCRGWRNWPGPRCLPWAWGSTRRAGARRGGRVTNKGGRLGPARRPRARRWLRSSGGEEPTDAASLHPFPFCAPADHGVVADGASIRAGLQRRGAHWALDRIPSPKDEPLDSHRTGSGRASTTPRSEASTRTGRRQDGPPAPTPVGAPGRPLAGAPVIT